MVNSLGDETRVFGTEARASGGEELEALSERRRGKQVDQIQDQFRGRDCFSWEERGRGTVSVSDDPWLRSREDQVRGLVRGKDEERSRP